MPLVYRRKKLSTGYRKKRVGRRRYVRRAPLARSAGVKKFVSAFPIQTVVALANGTNPDGYFHVNCSVSGGQSPIFNTLRQMYRQFAITGVTLEWRPTNTTPSAGDKEAVPMLFVEDKDTATNLTATQMLSQNDCKQLTSQRKFSKYIRMPRPNIYTQDSAGQPIRVADASKRVHWLSFTAANTWNLDHLCGQFAFKDLPAGIVAGYEQGQIWAKLYMIVKEQSL